MDATDSEDACPAAADVVAPSLHRMPEAVLGRILQNFKADEDASTLVSLEMVCSSLKSALSSDVLWAQTLDNGRGDAEFLEEPRYEGLPTWREYALRRSALTNIHIWQTPATRKNREAKGTANIVLDTLGGIDAVRNLATALLHRMNAAVDEAIHQMHLRTDTVSYLAELLQEYMVTKLKKAFACTTFRSGPEDKDPIVHADDIAFLSKLDVIGAGMTERATAIYTRPFMRFSTRAGQDISWVWPADHCSDLLSSDESRLLIRRFAYRAGICKIGSDAFEFAASDFLHTMSFLLIDAFEACKGMAPTHIETLEKVEDQRYITSDQGDKILGIDSSINIEYYQNFCPPFRSDENGKIECTIIPRQIQDAASRCGLKKVYGYNSAGWYELSSGNRPGISSIDEDETEEIMSQYYVDGDGYESAEGMVIDEEDSDSTGMCFTDEESE